ncbi:MAG: DUF4258 domain-containing protein [archaeon]
MGFQFSRHALEKARERGISINEIRRTVQRGAKHVQNGKIVADFGHIRVVYKKIDGVCSIITVMIR